MLLGIDIETVPQEGIMGDAAYVKWARAKNPNADDKAIEKVAGLHAEYGMIVCVGFAYREKDGKMTTTSVVNTDGEREMLKEVADAIDEMHGVQLVGHNIKGFDIPFLAKRMLANGIRVPSALSVMGKKPWEINHVDTLEQMRFGGDVSMSLQSACRLFGLEDPKAAVNGSEVAELYKDGKLDEIAKYCEGDAKMAYIVWEELKNNVEA